MSEIGWIEFFSQYILFLCAGHCLVRLGEYLVTLRRQRKDAQAGGSTVTTHNPVYATTKGYRKPGMDSTLGYRGWHWGGKELLSPVQGTSWPGDGILCAQEWDKEAAVRGRAGIHAKWPVPSDWSERDAPSGGNITGIVERFGKYVLGEDGWRAEWAVIKELACSSDIVEAVRAAYPGIPVRVSQHLTDAHVRAKERYAGLGSGISSGVWTTTTLPSGVGTITVVGGGGGGGGSGTSGYINPHFFNPHFWPSAPGVATITSGVATSGCFDPTNWGQGQASGINCSLPMDVCPCPSCTGARGGTPAYPWPIV